MSRPLSEDEEVLLAEVLAGGRPADDPAVLAVAAENPTFGDRLAELRELVGALDAAGARERELLTAAADEPGDPALDDLVARTVARLAGGADAGAAGPAAPVKKGPGRWWLALAAAAVITVLWGIFREPGRAPVDEDRQQLSGKKLELEAPVEDSEGIDLRWRCSEPNATFEVLLYDPAVGEHVALAEAEELNTTRWYIDAKVARTLPPNTIWRVTMRVGGRRVSEERALR